MQNRPRHTDVNSEERTSGVRMLLTRTYDEFFASRTPVTNSQFAGLILLGGALILSGVVLFTAIVSRLSGASWGGVEAGVLLFALVICGAIVCFGILHFKRAFAGRRR